MKINVIINRKLSFKQATFVSLILHLLMFLIIYFFINITDKSKITQDILSLNFTFEPAEIDQETASAGGIETNNYQPAKRQLPRATINFQQTSDLIESLSNNKIAENKPAPHNQAEDSGDVEKSSSTIEKSKTLNLNNPFIIPNPAALGLRKSILDSNPVKIHAARLPMSQRQEKIVLKKVKSLAEKLRKSENPDTIFWHDKDHYYKMTIYHEPAKNTTGLDELVFEVSTKKDGLILTNKIRMRRLAFSNYAHFIDYWDPMVAVHNDEIDGRFHTNNTFNISREKGIGPKFHGKVTSASYDVKTSGTFPIIDYESIFLGGLETGVKEINFPISSSPITNIPPEKNQRVHQLFEETWITFFREGTYSWRSKSIQNKAKPKTKPLEPFYIVAEKKINIHIKGVVKGKILIYSGGDIIIDDDLSYSDNPELSFKIQDFLGLVSQRDVRIAHPSVTGPGDLKIFAAIYAKKRFRVPNLSGHGEATLYIYGSLSAGSLSATEPRYATKVVFDKRLESQRPPNFPLTDHYEITEWDKKWTVKFD